MADVYSQIPIRELVAVVVRRHGGSVAARATELSYSAAVNLAAGGRVRRGSLALAELHRADLEALLAADAPLSA